MAGDNVILMKPSKSRVDHLWDAYEALGREVVDNPLLALDRKHSEATVRAWAAWRDAFVEWSK